MIIDLITLVVFWLSILSPPPSISVDLSPLKISTGMTVDYNNHCKIEFDECSQVHEAHYNTMQYCFTGSTAIHPTGNAQGAYYLNSLSIGRHMNCQKITPFPLPQ